MPSFFAWEPVPPAASDGDEYVVLGMVITGTDEPPPPTSVRCLHRSLCMPAKKPPSQLWVDKGLGGAAGSLWTVNNLQCLWATQGYDAPTGSGEGGAFWELREWPFTLDSTLGEEGSPEARP